ncbi:hypothetical protein LBW56_24250 [Ralstonia solanacearum]|uniref:hypothetical protein n=1 Tax=Ralstonia solanacearum TaxID=305 RepID=UPI001FF7F970|nr:hypothetical protein [Ralstonia solanacearum]MDB0529784.1 hypothetical protein [Ralstonia solanacearum]
MCNQINFSLYYKFAQSSIIYFSKNCGQFNPIFNFTNMRTGSVSSGYTGYAHSSDDEASSYSHENFRNSSPGRRASAWLEGIPSSPPRAANLRISAPQNYYESSSSGPRLAFSASTAHRSSGGAGEPAKTGRNEEMARQDAANKGAEHLYAQHKGAPLSKEIKRDLKAGHLARDGSPTTGRMTIQAYKEMCETGHKSFKDKTPRMSWR